MNRLSGVWILVLVLAIHFTSTGSAQEATSVPTDDAAIGSTEPDPLQIEEMRQRSYPSSPITFEQTLNPGRNYSRYIVSYESDGYKIYALMTIPAGTAPDTGWPVIVFNHGYITPELYRTTENYVAYVDNLAQHGYIVFKPDYRGHGSSEGGPEIGGGFGTPDYAVDVLNAIAALQAYEGADPDRIGMWGHSMGGQITLRAMVVSQDIKAGVIWGGVVAPYPDIIDVWDYIGQNEPFPPGYTQAEALRWGQNFSDWVAEFSATYGTFEENPDLWATISPNSYLEDLSGPIQLHHSVADIIVPLAWSQTLVSELQAIGFEDYEFYTYPNDNHNISVNFDAAMQRTLNFFATHLQAAN